MQLDPQQSLQLALRHLEAFSVPSIGTFVRKRVAAQIDHQTKRILPPQEAFVLEAGQSEADRLANFFQKYYHVDAAQANAMAESMGERLANALGEHGIVQIEGFGKLRKEEGSDIEFISENSIFGQANDLFGLQTVDYTVGESTKPSLEKKKAAAVSSTLANQTIVEPVRRRRKFPFGWVMFLLIIGGGAVACWYWQDELKLRLEKAGIFPKSVAIADTTGENGFPEWTLSDSLEKIRQEVLEDSLAAIQSAYADSLQKADNARIAMENGKAEVKPEPKPAVKPEPKPAVKPESKPALKPGPKPAVKPEPKPAVKPEPKPAVKPSPKATPEGMTLNDGKYGSPAQNGHYYLVVASTQVGAEAVEMAKGIKGGMVLAPYYLPGYYKVAVFESAAKSNVISQMVALKDRYPKSWIYWAGMPVGEK